MSAGRIKHLMAKFQDASGDEVIAYEKWLKAYQRSVTLWQAYRNAERRTKRAEKALDKAGKLATADELAQTIPWEGDEK